jgi:hypothetical protein
LHVEKFAACDTSLLTADTLLLKLKVSRERRWSRHD